MQQNKKIDIAVLVIAIVFILIGILSIAKMIYALTQKGFTIDSDVLGIFIGVGLLRRGSSWRKVALVYAGLYAIMYILSLPLSFFVKFHIDNQFLWFTVTTPAKIIVSVLVFVVYSAIFIILKLPSVRELFDEFKEPWGVSQDQ